MTAADFLKEGRKLIAAPERWTTNVEARDAEGQPVAASSARAMCWCSVGALYRVAMIYGLDGFGASLGKLTEQTLFVGGTLKNYGVSNFNDNRTHAEVLELWDRAIEKAEASA